MASSSQQQQPPSRVLQEELTCPVCLEVYRDPHLLRCGHNFCLDCLQRLQGLAENQHYSCPECRAPCRVGTDSQRNFKLANIADDYRRLHHPRAMSRAMPRPMLRASGEPSGGATGTVVRLVPMLPVRTLFFTPCDFCPPVLDLGVNGGQAVGRKVAFKMCLKCEVSMCRDHVRPHMELPAFREHLLTEPLADLRSRKCQEHNEIYRFYCMDDGVCVCSICIVEGGHTGHTIKNLKDTMVDFKEGLAKHLSKITRKYHKVEKNLNEQKEKERKNQQLLEDSAQCMFQLVEDLRASVSSFVSKLRGCVEAHCDANEPIIEKNIDRIGQDQERLDRARSSIMNLLQEDDAFSFIKTYKTTGKQRRLEQRKSIYCPENVDMETNILISTMVEEMRNYQRTELHTKISTAIGSFQREPPLLGNEEEQGESEEDEYGDELYDRSEAEEEEDEEEEDEEEEPVV